MIKKCTHMDWINGIVIMEVYIYPPFHALLKTAHLTYLALSIPYPMTISLILATWSSFPGECSVAGGPFEERRYCFS